MDTDTRPKAKCTHIYTYLYSHPHKYVLPYHVERKSSFILRNLQHLHNEVACRMQSKMIKCELTAKH